MLTTAEDCWHRAEIFRVAKRYEDADQAYRQVLATEPGFMPALANFSLLLSDIGTADIALVFIRRAVAVTPTIPQLYLNLGNALAEIRSPESISAFRSALVLNPSYTEAWLNIGVAVHQEGYLTSAIEAARRAISLRSEYAEAWNNRGNALRDLGRSDAALAAYERALHLRPDYIDAARNILAARLYLEDDDDGQTVLAEALRARFGPSRSLAKPTPSKDPDRLLRVGILSSDLRDHPVGRNLMSLFRYRDRCQLFLAGYDTGRTPDEPSAWFAKRTDLWRQVGSLSDANIADLIRADGIDILILLAGRFDSNRPLVAAWNAAPVQIAMHDGGPSGMNANERTIDALITDSALHPSGDIVGRDRLLRLPVFYNFPPPENRPSPIRRDAGNSIIFGSFSNPAKLSVSLLHAWGRILSRVPQAQLVLKYRRWYADEGVYERVISGVASGGGSPSALRFLANADDATAHLAQYGHIDLALDTFPFSGATTSFEALAMGVPVLTLAGRSFISRTTTAILTPLGFDDFISLSVDDYVERAVAFAASPERLRQLRQEIPNRLGRSPLLDGEAYTTTLTRALRELWREYCQSRVTG